jgi:hypothetical protein
MPFQFGELRQVRQGSSGMRAKVPREIVAILSDARPGRGMLANEGRRDVSHEFGTDKPDGGWEPFDQRAGQARHIVALMNRETVFGTSPS